MFSATQLFQELHNFKKEAEKYQEQKHYMECFWFYKAEGKMFDVDGLNDHLRDNPICDKRSYADIVKTATCIVNLYNDLDGNKEPRRFDNELLFDENRSKFYGNRHIVAIEVRDGRFVYWRYIDDFDKTLKTHEDFSFYQIATICCRIVNMLAYFGHAELQNLTSKTFDDYCDLGVMVVIKKEIKKVGSNYCYNGVEYSKVSELEKHLHDNKLCKTISIRQWLSESFIDDQNKSKNLFNEKRVKKIIQYCYFKDIAIPEEAKTEYSHLL